MPRRLPTRFRWQPRDAPAFFEFHDVVLADIAAGEGHGEDVSLAANALSRFGFGEVIVAVPERLLHGIGYELEYSRGARGDLSACTRHSRNIGVVGHDLIEACAAAVTGEALSPPQSPPRRVCCMYEPGARRVQCRRYGVRYGGSGTAGSRSTAGTGAPAVSV